MTFVLGILGSLATGATDPKDVDGDLLSPPIRDLLSSLPNRIKEKLNIPLKIAANSTGKSTQNIKEAFTINLEVFDREKKQNGLNEKIRKISAPS